MSFERIETQTLSTAAGTITFSSLGQYKDLMVVFTGLQTSGANSLRIRVGNGSVDTGNNYTIMATYLSGTSVGSGGEDNTSAYCWLAGDGTSTVYSNYLINFIDYANTNKYKQINSFSARSDAMVAMENSVWKSTAAITVISFAFGAGFPTANIASGTKAILYGIK